LVVLALAATAAIWFRSDPKPAPVAQDREGPVLLVPGRNADSGPLVDLQRRLFLSGRRAIIVSTGIEDTGDLRAQARQVEKTARELIAKGAPSVDVVGYSAGGVVTRLWLAQGGDALARRVITLGSPNLGASEAQMNSLVTKRYCATTCPQLAPGSALLKELPPAKASVPWINVWTTRDRVVDQPSAQLPGALNVSLQSICPKNKTGHTAMPSDPLVIGIVLRAVGRTPVSAVPTKADCSPLRQSGSPDVVPGVAPSSS